MWLWFMPFFYPIGKSISNWETASHYAGLLQHVWQMSRWGGGADTDIVNVFGMAVCMVVIHAYAVPYFQIVVQ